ncbi:MAG TPA: M20/M25/M40 family metallo-hydrolase [Gammaproteobacteria bacterium]|nr:M20/M25/M40 family metallo-hydrolase [Gammaproteobacteria bacterium]
MYRYLAFLLTAVVIATGCTDNRPQQDVAALVARVEQARLSDHIVALLKQGPRTRTNVAAMQHSVAYISSQLTQYGYRPYTETLAAGGVNILAERRGTGTPRRVLELAAHYDTRADTPGADDNASGVAALLEVARLLAQAQPHYTVRFCFFDHEEDGLAGSRHHVQLIRARNEPLLGAIVLEMVGYATEQPRSQGTPLRVPLLFSPPTTGNFIAVAGNIPSGGLGNRFERAADVYVPALPYFSANRLAGFLKDALRSDHSAYWDSGYRAIMLTDTADFRNPHYHQPSDTLETLNLAFLQNVTRAVLASLLVDGVASR